MDQRFQKVYMALGEPLEFLQWAHILLVGLGGVGSHAAEALARTGFQNITLVDYDLVELSNTNRQLIATSDTVGVLKTKATVDRLLSINPRGNFQALPYAFSMDNISHFEKLEIHLIIDTIDLVTYKLQLWQYAQDKSIPIFSALGTGNRLDPTKLTWSTLYKTYQCPFAKVLRREAKKRNLQDIPVVFSTEEAMDSVTEAKGRYAPASLIFVPGTAGYMLAQRTLLYFLEKRSYEHSSDK